MSDRTPRKGEHRGAQDRLDDLLASHHSELSATMTRALDTQSGIETLAPLRERGPLERMRTPSGFVFMSDWVRPSPPGLELVAPPDAEGPPDLISLIHRYREALLNARTVVPELLLMEAGLLNLALGLQTQVHTLAVALELIKDVDRQARIVEPALASRLESSHALQQQKTLAVLEIVRQLRKDVPRLRALVIRLFDAADDTVAAES
ncbi:hypothetical protein ACIP79_19745 [Streptomyces sp. NPDC088747]|uniref:hypothetical protein n=1 Tax=Streptomyces sp. NPDC088747 TaxID=3365886 RepID=UPI0037F8DEE4